MDEQTWRSLLSEWKNKIIDKIDSTAEQMNSKIENNKNEINFIKDEVASYNEKLDNISVRSETNTEDISDLKIKVEKLEKEKELNHQRFGSIKAEIDGEKINTTPPKIKLLMKDVTKLMDEAINKNDINDIKEKISVKDKPSLKLWQSPIKVAKTDNKIHSSNKEDIYVEKRGKVGIYPKAINDIRRQTKDDVSDDDLSKSFSYIKARVDAAKEYFNKQLMFNIDEIEIKTSRMSSNP